MYLEMKKKKKVDNGYCVWRKKTIYKIKKIDILMKCSVK